PPVIAPGLHWRWPIRSVRIRKNADCICQGIAPGLVPADWHTMHTIQDAGRGGRPSLHKGGPHRMNSLPMVHLSEEVLREKETKYCSHGDTVHYSPVPKFFQSCEGSFLYDREDKPYLDLQMWYSAVNFGYRNQTLIDALKAQLDRLPQLAC